MASQALRDMGPVAEDAVLPLFEHPDWPVRLEAYKVLKAIGTGKSIEPLKKLLARSKGLVAEEAKKALRAIESRG